MQPLGFSTGALAKGDFRRGLDLTAKAGLEAVELSALRERELEPLLEAIPSLDLAPFDYVSFHVPSGLAKLREETVVETLCTLPPSMALIVHPDIIGDYGAWERLGSRVCLENMDRRKPVGRTSSEMLSIFERLPEARFCFDIGHARQIDRTMTVAASLLRQLRGRLVQVHMSDVGADAKHRPLDFASIHAFRSLATLIPPEVPVILESVVEEGAISEEIANARRALASTHDAGGREGQSENVAAVVQSG